MVISEGDIDVTHVSVDLVTESLSLICSSLLADGFVFALVCLYGSQVRGEEKFTGGLQPSDCIARTREQMESAEMCPSLRWTVRISTCSCAAARYS